MVGPRIRALRNRRGRKVTQQELAAWLQAMGLDIDQPALSRIERGERLIADFEMATVAQALGVEIGKLFPGLSAWEG